jgi:hypothetical protein
MVNITVDRYRPYTGTLPEGTRDVTEEWQGVIEPDDKSWIAFVDKDGKPLVFLDRDPKTGAVRG